MKYFLIFLSTLDVGMCSGGMIPLEIDTSDQAPIPETVVESNTLFDLFDNLMKRLFTAPARTDEPASPTPNETHFTIGASSFQETKV